MLLPDGRRNRRNAARPGGKSAYAEAAIATG
jgi:hypothetical protein